MAGITLHTLARELELSKPNFNELKKSLTHTSFYPDGKKSALSNSRYVFRGMFTFKGETADVLFDLVPGSGMQLQQILGNLFAQPRLIALFEKLNLKYYIRHGSQLDIEKHRHIFVYGLLGYLSEHSTPYEKLSFISNYVLPGYDLKNLYLNKLNIRAQLVFLCKMKYNCKPDILMTKTDKGLFEVVISVKSEELSRQQSISKEYATKKSFRKALLKIAETEHQKLQKDPEFITLMAAKNATMKEEEKEKKKKKYEVFLQKQQTQKQHREEKKLNLGLENEKKEKARKEAQLRKKKRMEDMARIRAQRSMVPLSANKRRFLEDKQK